MAIEYCYRHETLYDRDQHTECPFCEEREMLNMSAAVSKRLVEEGWRIMWSDDRNRWEIQRDDEAGIFPTDEDAESFVMWKSLGGSQEHSEVLAWLDEANGYPAVTMNRRTWRVLRSYILAAAEDMGEAVEEYPDDFDDKIAAAGEVDLVLAIVQQFDRSLGDEPSREDTDARQDGNAEEPVRPGATLENCP